MALCSCIVLQTWTDTNGSLCIWTKANYQINKIVSSAPRKGGTFIWKDSYKRALPGKLKGNCKGYHGILQKNDRSDDKGDNKEKKRPAPIAYQCILPGHGRPEQEVSDLHSGYCVTNTIP
jgi:hypothetical protein